MQTEQAKTNNNNSDIYHWIRQTDTDTKNNLITVTIIKMQIDFRRTVDRISMAELKHDSDITASDLKSAKLSLTAVTPNQWLSGAMVSNYMWLECYTEL